MNSNESKNEEPPRENLKHLTRARLRCFFGYHEFGLERIEKIVDIKFKINECKHCKIQQYYLPPSLSNENIHAKIFHEGEYIYGFLLKSDQRVMMNRLRNILIITKKKKEPSKIVDKTQIESKGS